MDKTTSTSFGFELTNEIGVTVEAIFSAKTSLKETFSYTSSQTWHDETTISDTISVKKGDSVVVWQYVYQA